MAFLGTLKAVHYFPPLAALILMSGWLVRQRQEAAEMRREAQEGRKQAATLKRTAADAETAAATSGAIEQSTLEKIHALNPAKLDWKKLAMAFNSKPDPQGPNEMEGLRLRIQGFLWTSEQLSAALDQIEKTPGLTEQEKAALLSQFESALAFRDPAAALKRLEVRMGTSETSPFSSLPYSISTALNRLARKDPAAAAEWLDRALADGRLKEDSAVSRQYVEAGLIGGLLDSDPAAAFQRLSAYPGEKRSLLSSIYPSEISAPAYLKMLQETLPAADVPGALTNTLYPLLWNGPRTTTLLLDRMAASPEERRAVAEKVTEYPFGQILYTRDVTEADVSEQRDWFATQAPGSENELTGKSLSKLLSEGSEDFSRIASMVTKYDPDGSSGMLTAFLKELPSRYSREAKALVERIADPGEREEVRQYLQP